MDDDWREYYNYRAIKLGLPKLPKIPKISKPEIILKKKITTSSLISHISYVPPLKVLQITFKNGNVYWYYNVPKSVYDEMLSSPSFGKYFWENIRRKYTHKKIKSIMY